MVKKQEMRSGAQPYEDRALKAAAQFFGGSCCRFWV